MAYKMAEEQKIQLMNFIKDKQKYEETANQEASMTPQIIKINPVKQRKFVPTNSESFYWCIWDQMRRSETGYKHYELLTPWQLKQSVCDYFLKSYEENDPVICNIVQKMIKAGKIFDVKSFLTDQKQVGKFAESPIVEAMASYLNVDIFILSDNHESNLPYEVIKGSSNTESSIKRPPFIIGRKDNFYQSYEPMKA